MSKRPSRTLAIFAAAVAAAVVSTLCASFPDAAVAAKEKPGLRRVTAEEQLAFGVNMAKRGLWREALFRFERARQLDPSKSRVLNNLAVAYEAVGEFDRAMDLYKDALQAEPGNRELRRNYARFVEFYQSFRPEAAEDADGDSEDGAESAESTDSEDPSDSGQG